MVDKPAGPNPNLPTSSHEAKAAPKPFSYEKGEWHVKPMTFLGMHFDADQAKKLWNTIIQSISSAISRDKERALKALKKLGKDDGGADDS